MVNIYMDDVRACPYVNFEVVRTVEEAQRLLATDEVNHCSLDHDMGACEACVASGEYVGDMATPETTFMNWCPHAMDGTKLVRWMIETGHWPKQKPVVHSANPEGKKRMVSLINQFWGEPAMGPMF